MCINLNSIKSVRMDQQGQPVPQNKKTGIKWGLISAVATLALAILAACVVVNIVFAGFAFASGNIAGGILMLGGAVMIGLSTYLLGQVVKDCILNAHHHLKKQPAIQNGRIRAVNT